MSMTTYDFNEVLDELANTGVIPEYDIPVETDYTGLVSVKMGFPMPSERIEMLKDKTIMWVPFICDDGEYDE